MKHIGLVLSGGMGKGAYQIGALEAINEIFKPTDFEYVSAASIGALNAYAYLTNGLENAKNIWKSVNFKSSKSLITSVLKSDFLPKVIKEIIVDKEIIPTFYVPLLNATDKLLTYFDFSTLAYEELEIYLNASIALPVYCKSVNIKGKAFYDGAFVDNIPVYPVLKNNLDYVICIYFDDYNYIFEDYSNEHKIIKLTFPDDKFIKNSVQIKKDSIALMMRSGYDRTKDVLDEIFINGIDDLEHIYKQIRKRNEKECSKNMRITGDVITTNMNKVVKKLLKKRPTFEEH